MMILANECWAWVRQRRWSVTSAERKRRCTLMPGVCLKTGWMPARSFSVLSGANSDRGIPG